MRSPVLHFLAAGNKSKLGKRILSFSEPPAREYCPGSTEACRRICYASKSFRMYPSVRKLYTRNSGLTPDQIEGQILKPGSIVRLYVAGDHNSPAKILAWRRLAKANPTVRFYGYTRSWRESSLLPALEALRALPNVKLFASLDEQTGMPPAGWQWAMMGQLAGMNAPGSIQCPEQTGRVKDCSSCGLCFNMQNTRLNLTFAAH